VQIRARRRRGEQAEDRQCERRDAHERTDNPHVAVAATQRQDFGVTVFEIR